MERAKGIDISHHQSPDSIDWDAAAKELSFVYIRATYGTRPDKHFIEHVKAAQGVGLRVGAYHFLRQTQDAHQQVTAFLEALDAAGCGPGWLPPAIDVEDNAKYDGELDPKLYRRGAQTMADWCVGRYGRVVIYTSQRDWGRIGNPRWLENPAVLLWVAHWTRAAAPATPLDLPWDIWQYRTKPSPSWYSGPELDQNCYYGRAEELPVLGGDDADTLPPDAEDEPTLANVLAAVRSAAALMAAIKGGLDTLVNDRVTLRAELRQYQEEVRGTATSLAQRITALEQAKRGNGAPPC